MVLPQENSLLRDIKISSVGPGHVSGTDLVHYPSDLDLAMKLHYFKAVYFFHSHAQQVLTIMNIKEKMFNWFNYYFITCGRFRRSDSGRPFIKCNDCGARFIEANCDKTMDEWFEMKDWTSYNKLLTPQQVLGPELSFSPPVLFQLTQFKCGGFSMAMSWAHVLGDPFTASDFINIWGELMSGLQQLNRPYNIPKTSPTATDKLINGPTSLEMEPVSACRVDPVGDHWITPNNCKMGSMSLSITSALLNHIKAKTWGSRSHPTPAFETLCAIIWQCIAKVKKDHDAKIVTLCRYDQRKATNATSLGNNQVIAKVEAGFSVVSAELKELATLLVDQAVDERAKIEQAVLKDQGVTDFCLYGAKLTFVNLEEADLYGLELNGIKPEFVYCSIQGVGDEGAVLVLPWPKGGEGRLVTITLREDQLLELKVELKQSGLLHESGIEE